jgi:glycosyltransferase involved in cell wall biosynthesis
MLRLLTYTTLYPNPQQPRHGIFVEQRLRQLVRSGQVASHVVAPVAWLVRDVSVRRIPAHEERHAIPIDHPRYAVVPKVGMSIAPALLAASTLRALERVRAAGHDFAAIDAHYLYPDGVAAAWLARRLGKPLVLTARGSDVNLLPLYALPRRQILWATRRAAAVITVSRALEERLVALGVPADRITTLRNGVDLELFRPGDRAAARSVLGLAGRTLLSVGHLEPNKGHHVVLEALAALPGTTLVIAGDGPQAGSLRALAHRLGLADRVRFVGTLPQQELPSWYGAADALVLASSREGMPNVVLEALACGTPVVATAVGGIPEIVSDQAAGVLMVRRDARALVEALEALFRTPPDRAATRQHAERFDWRSTTEGQLCIFREAIERAGSADPTLARSRPV